MRAVRFVFLFALLGAGFTSVNPVRAVLGCSFQLDFYPATIVMTTPGVQNGTAGIDVIRGTTGHRHDQWARRR